MHLIDLVYRLSHHLFQPPSVIRVHFHLFESKMRKHWIQMLYLQAFMMKFYYHKNFIDDLLNLIHQDLIVGPPHTMNTQDHHRREQSHLEVKEEEQAVVYLDLRVRHEWNRYGLRLPLTIVTIFQNFLP